MSVRKLAAMAAWMAAAPALAQTAPGPSAYDRANSSPEDLARLTLGDLKAMLAPNGEYAESWDIDVGESWLFTKATGSSYSGLCRRDVLAVSYVEAPDAGGDPNYPRLRPHGLKLRTQYRVIAGEVNYGGVTWEQAKRTGYPDGNCAAKAGTTKGWFFAEDEETAAYGFDAIAAAVSRLRSGDLKIESCGGSSRDPKECLDRIRVVADPDRIESIRQCDADAPEHCYEVVAGFDVVTIRYRDAPLPSEILGVSVGWINNAL